MGSQQALDRAYQVKVKQIRRREVNCDGPDDALLAPASDLSEGDVERVVGHFTHQPGAFGGGQEFFR